ncbi:hypothetical protein GQX73_g9118 [Xylaria multiplex]|uniref:RmlD-like substrate binding domain-containing protein n=1 Tax=Xylaria multiplex TaxID=323545 RepID=A0A7C8III6_9PEZI|nr:hypothetical protein GQX73_g9118 [Xylaria multiplex]
MSAKTVLVTGATGLLGRQVVRAFERGDWSVKGTGHSRADGSTILKVDLAKPNEAEAALDRVKPNVVVHCAANRFPDKCDNDPEGTRNLNVAATESLASLCAARDILLIYISTDYVFPGKPSDAPYAADAPPQPTNFYGQTKLDGERAVLDIFKRASKPGLGIVLRVPVLYGDAEVPAESAVNVLMDSVWKVQEPDTTIKMDHWALRYPTNTEDVGRVCHDVAVKYLSTEDSALPRILQFSSEDRFTKYEICQVFGEIMGLPIIGIKPNTEGNDPNATVQRPYDCHLSPLPTNFALASSCATELTDIYKVYTSFDGWYFLLQGPVEQTSCYPSGYTADSRQYYSPARCPTGFTSACQSKNIAGTVSETVLTASYGWEQTLGCVNPQDSSTTTVWTVTQVSSGQTARTTYTNVIGGINAYQVQVGFQSTDFASSTTTSTTVSTYRPLQSFVDAPFPTILIDSKSKTTSQTRATTHTTAISAGSTSGSSSSSSSNKKKTSRKHSIGSGAIAGIVIGAIVGVVVIIALIWHQIRRKRGQNEETPRDGQGEAQPDASTEKFNDIAPSQTYQVKDMPENAAGAPEVVYEMATHDNAIELDTGYTPPYTNTQYRASH